MSIQVRITQKAAEKMVATFAENKERYGRNLRYVQLSFGPGEYSQKSHVTVDPDNETVIIHLGAGDREYRRLVSCSLVTCDLRVLWEKAQAGLLERMTRLTELGNALRNFVSDPALAEKDEDEQETDPDLDTETEEE